MLVMNMAITLSLYLLITTPYEAGNKKQFAEIPHILAKLRNKSADNEEGEREGLNQFRTQGIPSMASTHDFVRVYAYSKNTPKNHWTHI